MTSIFDMLTDPGTDALLGLTQGFGQAAMPTRMPTPFGAVLGMGAGGALQGVQSGQALRHAGIQNQQAQLGLDWYKNMLGGGQGAPFGAPGGSGQVDSNGQYIVSPRTLASMMQLQVGMGKDPAGLAKLIESYATAGRAISPQGNIFSIPGGAGAIATEAAAKAAGTKAGEAPYVPPTPFDVPVVDSNGQPVLGTDGQPTFRKQLMTPPQANSYVTGGAAPSGAISASQWAQRVIGTEGVPGNPAAKNQRSSATGDGQFIKETWIDQVRKQYPQQTAQMTDPQILELRKDPILSHQMTMAYGAENVDPLTKAGLPVNAATLAAAHNLGPGDAAKVLIAARAAPQTPLSGILSPDVMMANPSFAKQTAGSYTFNLSSRFGASPVDFSRGAPVSTMAPVGTTPNAPVQIPPPGIAGPPVLPPQQEADLKVNTANRMPADLRMGGERVQFDKNGQPIGAIKNPEHITVENADGTKTIGHMAPPAPGAPEGAPGTFVPVQQIGPNGKVVSGNVGNAVAPDVQKGRDEVVKDFNTHDAAAYQSAQNVKAWVKQISHAADSLNDGSPLYQTGPYGETRLGAMAGVNDFMGSLGLKPVFDVNKIASAEEIKKAQTTGGFELAAAFEGHSKQAASTIMNATTAIPGMHNTPTGLKLVASGINETSQFGTDEHEYKMARFEGTDPYGLNPKAIGLKGGAGLQTAEVDFAKRFPPEMYAGRAISTIDPPKVAATSLSDANQKFEKYLPGTQVILNGQRKIVPERPGAPHIPDYIRERFMQPQAVH